jgi:hypothetical protein
VLLVIVSRFALADPPAPATQIPLTPTGMVQAYQLGYDIYLPVAQVQYFNHEVLTLSGANDAENAPKIAELDKLADRTRQVEQLSMQQAADLLLKIGAPKDVRAPYEQAAAALAKPLTLAKDDKIKGGKKLDPASLRILSTMEESNRLIPGETDALSAWLLGHLSAFDWGFHVGSLEASLAVASDNDEPGVALLSTIPTLAEKAPATAPAGAKDAMLKLSHDIQKNQDVTQAMLSDATRALHKAFEGD